MIRRLLVGCVWLVAVSSLVVLWNPRDPAISATSSTATPTIDLMSQGQALFVAKGCVSCHTHSSVGSTMRFGPNLSSYRNTPDFLRKWLRDPAAVKPTTAMPNLQLAPAEIEALIAFLNQQTP